MFRIPPGSALAWSTCRGMVMAAARVHRLAVSIALVGLLGGCEAMFARQSGKPAEPKAESSATIMIPRDNGAEARFPPASSARERPRSEPRMTAASTLPDQRSQEEMPSVPEDLPNARLPPQQSANRPRPRPPQVAVAPSLLVEAVPPLLIQLADPVSSPEGSQPTEQACECSSIFCGMPMETCGRMWHPAPGDLASLLADPASYRCTQ